MTSCVIRILGLVANLWPTSECVFRQCLRASVQIVQTVHTRKRWREKNARRVSSSVLSSFYLWTVWTVWTISINTGLVLVHTSILRLANVGQVVAQ